MLYACPLVKYHVIGPSNVDLVMVLCGSYYRSQFDNLPCVLSDLLLIYQVILLVFVLMMAFAVLIWVGRGKNPIDSSVMARVCMLLTG